MYLTYPVKPWNFSMRQKHIIWPLYHFFLRQKLLSLTTKCSSFHNILQNSLVITCICQAEGLKKKCCYFNFHYFVKTTSSTNHRTWTTENICSCLGTQLSFLKGCVINLEELRRGSTGSYHTFKIVIAWHLFWDNVERHQDSHTTIYWIRGMSRPTSLNISIRPCTQGYIWVCLDE